MRKKIKMQKDTMRLYAGFAVAFTIITSYSVLSVLTLTHAGKIPEIRSQASVRSMRSFEVASADMGGNSIVSLSVQADKSIIKPYETLRLTSVGLFVSGDAPVASKWYARKNSTESELTGCSQKKTCDFSTDAKGNVEITAKAQGKSDSVMIKVIGEQAKRFADAIPDWANAAVMKLNDRSIMRGYDDGRFGPEDNLTRGQIITLLHRVLLDASSAAAASNCQQYSPSVPYGHFAYDALCLFTERGWESGWTFDANEPVSRGETAAYVNRVFGPSMLKAFGIDQGQILSGGQVFADVPTDEWYFFDTGVTNALGIMTGNPDGTFGVGRILNRAEAAVIVERTMELLSSLDIDSI